MQGLNSPSKFWKQYPQLIVTSFQGSLTCTSTAIKKTFEHALKTLDKWKKKNDNKELNGNDNTKENIEVNDEKKENEEIKENKKNEENLVVDDKNDKEEDLVVVA